MTITKAQMDAEIDAQMPNNTTNLISPAVQRGVLHDMVTFTTQGVSNINVQLYGAKGDGVTNDSVAIQNAINYANSIGGGYVIFPPGIYLCNIVLANNVQLVAPYVGQYMDLAVSANITTLLAAGGGAVIDTPPGGVSLCSIMGFGINGPGAGTPCIGIHLRSNTFRVLIQNCSFNNFADQAVLWDAGFAVMVYNCFVENCLLNRTRANRDGTISFSGTDGYLVGNELTSSSTSLSAGQHCGAAALYGSNHFVSENVFETSDYGVYVGGTLSKFTSNRSDSNWAQGWVIDGNQNTFVGNHTLTCARAAANTYAAFHCRGTGGQNYFTGCFATSTGNTYSYCFENDFNNTSQVNVNQRNLFVGCFGDSYGTALFGDVSTSCPADFHHPRMWLQNSGLTTYDVTYVGLLQPTDSGAITITALTGGTPCQVVRIVGNSNVTLANGTSLKTNTGANKTLANNKVYTFTCVDSNSTFVENA